MHFSFIVLSLITAIQANPISPKIIQARQDVEDPYLIYEGFYLLVTTLQGGSDLLAGIGNSMATAFKGDASLPFENKDNCIMTISTFGGGHCSVVSNPAAKSGTTQSTTHDPTHNPWEVCWWNTTTDVSGKQYFNDPGVGEYMIEWMSKDGKASADATGKNRAPCEQAGVCDPLVTFFRDGYNLQLYTYETLYQGSDYAGETPGLCQGGDVNQFHKGGALYSYKCAIPCANQGSLPANTVGD